ncbi:MAG: PEP-CTERM sorting domain-containing protein [Planctomycetota bacterium]
MLRTTLLALAAALMMCGTSNAEFFIDNFQTLDNPNDLAATSIGSNGITVEVDDNNGGSFANDVQLRYEFTAANVGDTFVVRYDWAGIFNDLQSVSGNQLESVAIGAFLGDWSMTIDNGTGGPAIFPGPALPTILPSPIAMDNATFLEFTFTYNGGSPLPGGIGVGTWGGLGNPLFATPEPTGLLMLGCVGLVGLARRRRR